jgi:hypothetical protein
MLTLVACALAVAAAGFAVWHGDVNIFAAGFWVMCAFWVASDRIAGRSFTHLSVREIRRRFTVGVPPLPPLALALRAFGVFVATLTAFLYVLSVPK